MAQAPHRTMRADRRGAWLCAAGLLILASLALATSAGAKLSGEFTRFANCPYKDPDASKCIYSRTVGGEVVLGTRRVPILSPAILQGAYSEGDKAGFSRFIAPTAGPALSKAPQPLPGGLAGIVAPDKTPPLLEAGLALFFENPFTGAAASLELARPASEIRLSEEHLSGEKGTGLELPVKIHLQSPLLDPSCYIGSESSPIIWNLSTGTTHPPAPAKPTSGTVGKAEFLEEGSLLESKGTTLIDNAWAAPPASGCGGFLSFLIDPILNRAAGLPAAAGENLVRLDNSAFITPALAVKLDNEENP
jgi:hypothetical protein